MFKTLTTALALSMTFAAQSPANAQDRIGDIAYVTEGLIAVGIAVELSEVCETLSPRRLRGISYLLQLKNHAKGLGFTDAEIDAFVDNKSEQNRLEGLARARLVSMGAPKGDVEAHCRVGRAEIARGSPIGYLLR